jgi:hypothetical protein
MRAKLHAAAAAVAGVGPELVAVAGWAAVVWGVRLELGAGWAWIVAGFPFTAAYVVTEVRASRRKRREG